MKNEGEAVKRMAGILKALAKAKRPIKLTAIVSAINLPKPTVYRYLKYMEREGLVQRLEKRWALGDALWKMVNEDIESALERWGVTDSQGEKG